MSTLKTNNIQHVDLADPSILLNSDGSVSIAGTVSYEDATNVDSVGVVTARKQLHVGTGVSIKAGGLNVTAGIVTITDSTESNSATTGAVKIAGGLGIVKNLYTSGAAYVQGSGGLTVSNDVSIADKIIHTGDTDTAIRFPSANVISFEAGGSESFRVDTTGKLLVGQTSDSDGQLCMAGVLAFSAGGSGTASGANARPNISRGTDGQLILASGKDSGSSIRFDVAANGSTNAAEVARIDSSGRFLLRSGSSASSDLVGGFHNALQVEGTSAASSSIAIIRNSNDTNPPYLNFGKSRGTSVGSNDGLAAQDPLGQLDFSGSDGSGSFNVFASIRSFVDGTPGNSDAPGRLSFWTTPDSGNSALERLRIRQDGTVDIGGGSHTRNLTVHSATNSVILIEGNSDATSSLMLGDNDDEDVGMIQYNHVDNDLAFTVNASERLTINSSGNANFTGIVTATQFAPSHVQSSHKNIIINGDMRIAQRATTHNSSGYRTIDRFKMNAGGANTTLTQEQVDVASGTSPYVRGFRKAFKITNAGQNANNAGYVYMQYQVEAQDIATSGWRYMYNSSADDHITVSFWVKASVTQTYLFFFHTNDGTVKEFSHLMSLTGGAWTKVSITAPGNSGITINNDNGVGLNLYWAAYLGTDYTAGSTVDQWVTHSGYTSRPDMGTGWWTTSNSTFELTGVQLEVGKESSAFEHRHQTEELLRCQRYYYDLVQTSSTNDTFGQQGNVWQENNGSIMHIRYPVPMRTTPAFGSTNGTNYWRYFSGNDLATAYLNGSGLVNNLTRYYGGELYAYLSSGTGAVGRGMWLRGNNTAAKAYYDAEF